MKTRHRQISVFVQLCALASLQAISAAGVADLPSRLKLSETAQVEVFINGAAKGTIKMPGGTEFRPDGIEGDKVYVDVGGGERLYAPLSATNYRQALDADKQASDATSGAKEPLKKDAVQLKLKIGKLVPAGISSQEKKGPDGQTVKANTFVAGALPGNLKEGDWWSGAAYPIGNVNHPNTGETFACYTANLDEYYDFKIKNQDIVAAYEALAKKQGLKPKLDYSEFATLASSLQLDRTLSMSAGLIATQPADTTQGDEWGFEVSNKQILRLKAKESRIAWLKEIQPLWVKASELAGFWLKNREMSVPVQQWLKTLQDATLKFNSNEVTAFRQAVQKLHSDWADIQATSGG